MDALTFGDRKNVKRLLNEAGRKTDIGDRDIVVTAAMKLAKPAGLDGLEQAVSRVALNLSYQLIFSDNPAVRTEARQALLYLVLELDAIPDNTPGRGFDDDIYVMHRALLRIADLQGTPRLSLEHPCLTGPHALHVEQTLDAFRSREREGLEVTTARVEQRLASLRGSLRGSLMDDLDRNVRWLRLVVAETSDITIAGWAGAALSYVSISHELIPEDLGPISLFDDLYATQLALEQCNTPRAAIIRTLDKCAQRLHLLDMLLLRDKHGRESVSEYARLNLAVAERMLEKTEHERQLVHVPALGGTPLFVAFLAALARICSRRTELSRLPELAKGTLVQLVQGERKAIGAFQGYEDREGVTGMIVTDERLTAWFALTPQLLSSLTVARKGKQRGLQHISVNVDSLPITPLDFLLDTKVPLRLEELGCQVLFIANSMQSSRELLASTELCGVPMAEVLPVGRLPANEDGEPVGWSSRWQATPSTLAISSSMLEACEFLEENNDSNRRLVIVEDAGRWAKDSDLVNRLAAGSCPVLAFGSFADEQRLSPFARAGFNQMRWDIEELEQLTWPTRFHGITATEERLRNSLRAETTTVALNSPQIDQCWQSLDVARREVDANGGSDATEIALGSAWQAFTRASRWFLPARESSQVVVALGAAAEALDAAARSTILRAPVIEAFRASGEAVLGVRRVLEQSNEKWDRFRQLHSQSNNMVIVAANERAAEEYRDALSTARLARRPLVITPKQVPPSGLDRQSRALIPGWYKAEVMTSLLDPALAGHTSLLLWGFEVGHHGLWTRKRERAHTVPGIAEAMGGTFRRRTRRTKVITVADPALPANPDEVLESLEFRVIRARADRLGEVSRRGASANDLVEARLISLKDSQFVFMPSEGSAQLVTDLLRGEPSSAEKGRVRAKPVGELEEGDLLLFHTGSEGDALRAQADALMESEKPGSAGIVREQADQWRAALLHYKQRFTLSPRDLTERLERHGCKRNIMTIRKWLNDDSLIAPQNYRKDIEAVLALTGDAELNAGLKRCVNAIHQLRGKHLEASSALARTLLQRSLIGVNANRLTGDFGAGLFVAEVSRVDEKAVIVGRRALRQVNGVEQAA